MKNNQILPQQPMLGLARLFKMAFDGIDLAPLGAELITRAQQDSGDAEALMDLAIVLQLKYQQEVALNVQKQALAIKTLFHLPAEKEEMIKLLALMAPGDLTTNAPLEFLVQNSNISLDMLYIGPGLPVPDSLPEHDLAVIAIGESPATRPILNELIEIVNEWPSPVLNKPQNILKTSREDAPHCLTVVDSIIMPPSLRIIKKDLEAHKVQQPPFIVRPVGSHAGHGLMKIDTLQDIHDYLDNISVPEYYISPFIDYRSPDGLYRKYRIVLIGGKPFACHMGISENWMIHYLNAGMTESKEKRREEERFMVDFDSDFGKRHHDSLCSLYTTFDLDYLVIDCAETRDAKLLVFEIDTGAVIHAMDPPDIFPYKPPQMNKIFSAFYDLLADTVYE